MHVKSLSLAAALSVAMIGAAEARDQIRIVGSWLVFEPQIVEAILVSGLPPSAQTLPAGELNLLVADLRNIATANISSPPTDPAVGRD